MMTELPVYSRVRDAMVGVVSANGVAFIRCDASDGAPTVSYAWGRRLPSSAAEQSEIAAVALRLAVKMALTNEPRLIGFEQTRSAKAPMFAAGFPLAVDGGRATAVVFFQSESMEIARETFVPRITAALATRVPPAVG